MIKKNNWRQAAEIKEIIFRKISFRRFGCIGLVSAFLSGCKKGRTLTGMLAAI
jgi:hypothetical protein